MYGRNEIYQNPILSNRVKEVIQHVICVYLKRAMLLMDTRLIRQLILGIRYSMIVIGKKLKMVKKHIFLLI